MGPDDGGVENGAGLVDLYGEFLEESLPDARPGPAGESVVDGFPGAEAFGQVAPGDASLGSPDDGVDEIAVPALGNGACTDRKKRLDALPLSIGEFVSVHAEC